MSNFYTFDQNNPGGSFVISDTLCQFVVIEANDSNHANYIAKTLGIYFNGCDKGYDCPCCGDRWHKAFEYDANPSPMIYDKRPSEADCLFCDDGEIYCRIHYLNGVVEDFRK